MTGKQRETMANHDSIERTDQASNAAHDAALSAFVDALRAREAGAPRAAPTPLPSVEAIIAEAREVFDHDDRVALFAAGARKLGATVHLTDEASWPALLLKRLTALQVARLFADPHESHALDEAALTRIEPLLRAAGITLTRAWDDETLFSVDASLTGADAGIAETGSLVCTSGPTQPRGATLIPPLHFVLLRARRIAADLVDLYADPRLAADLPTNLNLITGPSKTADIEGILITGVHGPGRVEVFLIQAA